jgi:uncharacterized protein YjdB
MSTRLPFRAARAGRFLLLGALALVAGCEHGFYADAPRLPADLHVTYDLAPAAQIGGPEAAFDKVTAVQLSWSLASEEVHDTTIAFTPDAEVTVSLSIPMKSDEAQLQLSLALLSGADSIFTGATTTDLRAGQTTAAQVTLSPVAVGLSLVDGITMTAIGDTAQIGGSVVFATGDVIPDQPISWTSFDPDVASVTDDGRVVSHKEGQTRLYATSGALHGAVDLTVAAVVDAVRVAPDSVTVGMTRTSQLDATAVDRRGNALVRDIVWASSSDSVATVSASGLVKGVHHGKTTVTASAGGKSGSAAVTVVQIVSSVTVTPVNPGVTVGATQRLSATAKDPLGEAVAGKTFTWTSSASAVARVSSAGVVTGVAPGSAIITAAVDGVRGTTTVTVVSAVGAIAGSVANATTGQFIVGAVVELADTLGTRVTSVQTDAAGQFHIADVRAGVYRITARADGAIDDARRITVQAGQTTTVTFALSPRLAEGQTRIVLTWGALPTDLDSHLLVPNGSGSLFEVYYGNRGSETDPPYAQLDVDDTSGYGPETTTIFNQQQGTYCFFVYNFSGNGPLPASSAQVKVYRGDALVATFDTPAQDGRYWTVFSLNGDAINRIDSVGDSYVCPAVPAAMRLQMQNRPRKLK